MMNEIDFQGGADLLNRLADPVRLKILHLLRDDKGTISVEEISQEVEVRYSSVSYHLRTLYNAGLLCCRKQGIHCYYSLRSSRLISARDLLDRCIPCNEEEDKF